MEYFKVNTMCVKNTKIKKLNISKILSLAQIQNLAKGEKLN